MMEIQSTIEPAKPAELATIPAAQYSTAEDLLSELMRNVAFDGVPHSLMSFNLTRANALLELATESLEGEGVQAVVEVLYTAQAAVRATADALEAWYRGREIVEED